MPSSRVVVIVVVIVAAAAIGLGAWLRHPDPPVAPALVLITATTRGLEGRVSYAAADQHRPYDLARSGNPSPPGDAVSLATLAELERRADFHGVAAASLITGDLSRAAAYLDRTAPGTDVAADRALLQLATGHPGDALIALDRVLAAAPRHPRALWNRALALRDLGLALSAAEAFEAVAALGEPGWAAEAHARARRLAQDARDRRAALEQLALRDGPRLATAPDAVAPDIARRFPGMARLVFYDAVRSATSAGAVRALAPLARALDAAYGGDALASYVAHVARAGFAVRGPLAARYAAIVAGAQLDAAAIRSLLSALRAAHADDILLGALVKTAPYGNVAAAQIPELSRLAAATGDPWLELLATERAAAAQIAQDDPAAAEALALPALASCETSRLDYRCATLALILGESYRATLRLADARRVLAASIGRAHRGGEWYLEDRFFVLFAQIAMHSDEVVGSTLPIARAYVHELVLRDPERCDVEAWGSELIALLFVNRVDLAGARTELAHAGAILGRCNAGAPDAELTRSVEHLFVAAHVFRDPAAGSAGDVARVRAQIAHARQTATPGTAAMLDQIEGRLMLDRDRAAGTAALERAVAAADALGPGDLNGPKARAFAYSLLALDAGRAGEWDRVWALLARAARIPPVRRCTIGLAVEDGTSVAVVRDAGGASQGVFNAARPGPAIDAPDLVPAPLRAALQGCPEVDVLARPPVQGLPEVLPAEIAWSYRLDRTTARAPGASPPEAPPARPRRVVIADAEPPASLGVARLSPWRSAQAPDLQLGGPEATPSRALAELAEATFVEIHSHGMVDASGVDASFLMLSPDSDGRYALTAAAIRRQPLRGRPIVILAACHAASTATYRHEAWSLPAAFVAAGARAVIASTDVIDDAGAGALFDDLRARIERGSSAAIALRDARAAWLAAHPGAAWVRSLMVFQ